jgi:hypothetical protein
LVQEEPVREAAPEPVAETEPTGADDVILAGGGRLGHGLGSRLDRLGGGSHRDGVDRGGLAVRYLEEAEP